MINDILHNKIAHKLKRECHNESFIMGILNITDDSFSNDGLAQAASSKILQRAEDFLQAGADILDIGGESTRPGALIISAEQEYQRVIPVIDAIHHHFPEAILSVDTMKARVAEAALQAGASIVNDVTAGAHDPDMAKIVADNKEAVLVLMHHSARYDAVEKDAIVGASYQAVPQDDIIACVIQQLQTRIDAVCKAGVRREQLILDPGVGFGKTLNDNLRIINQLDRLKEFSLPILLGASRKSFIGKTLDNVVDDRLIGSVVVALVGQMRGADIIRVHDVAQTKQALTMLTAIIDS
ncbi:MAG: dihydropteroate synthase [Alphaproteobacteria bacterium]|nr:dihydropteroate synthase [Alphaproteobacteria bacterium]